MSSDSHPPSHSDLQVGPQPTNETDEVAITLPGRDEPPQLASLGRLIAEVAHEARNPLASILANLEAWEDEPEATFDIFGPRIRREAERMMMLMNDLLALARPRQRNSPVHVGPLVEEVVSSAELLTRPNEVAVDVSYGPNAGIVQGDAAALRRAFQNLVDNALQHTPDGGRISIRALTGSGIVVFQVEDDGPGFVEEELTQAFEPFYSRRRGGSGLGLAIVRKVVSEHGGRVAVANRSEGGAVASIFLPSSSTSH